MKAFALVIVLLAAGGAGWYWYRGKDGESAKSQVNFRTAKVDRGEIVEGVAASGAVEPVELVQVGTQISGVIREILTDFNAKVKANDPIARLDSRRLQAQVTMAEAALARAEADLTRVKAVLVQTKAEVVRAEAVLSQSKSDVDRARAVLAQSKSEINRFEALHAQTRSELERQRRLVASSATTRSELDAAIANEAALAAQLASARATVQQYEAQLASAEATVRQNEAQLEAAQASIKQDEAQILVAEATIREKAASLESDRVNLGYAEIVSPVDGVVVSRTVDVGQTVAASLSAPTLFVIARDLTRVRIQTSVPEADIGRIHEGQQATFTVDAYPDKVFEGEVAQVRLASTTVQNVVTYPVIVDASNPEGLLLPGMTANVTFEIRRSGKDVLRIPATALRVRPAAELVEGGAAEAKGKARTVYVKTEAGRLRPIAVNVGISDGVSTEVEPVEPGSLDAGIEVVTAVMKEQEAATTNPFAPQGGLGGRRGGR